MEHWILRCKHCYREYTYCTYGNGPEYGTEEGCSKEYCAECQKAIDNALSKINRKFMPRLKEIDDKSLLEHFDKIKEQDDIEDNPFGRVVPFEFEDSDYDVIETYYYNNNKYKVKYYDDNKDDKHIFVDMEYDLINECFTNKRWRYSVQNSYYHTRNYIKDMSKSMKHLDVIPINTIQEPTGKLFWMDFNTDDDGSNR